MPVSLLRICCPAQMDRTDHDSSASKDGSVVRYVDFPPAHESPMHRTSSIDYGIVVFGEVVVRCFAVPRVSSW